jgi:hypothetical protein
VKRLSFERLRLIGMVHLPALPGSPGSALPMQRIIDGAVDEARLLAEAGFEAVIVENFGDAPFSAEEACRETVASMAVVVDHVARSVNVMVGVNVLRNDALSGLAVAAVSGAAFIRVNVLSGVYATDQGMLTGQPRRLSERRAAVSPAVKIAADVHVKHAQPISQPNIALAAEETAYRARADALIVSGDATGRAVALESVKRVAQAVPDRPLWIGSGVTPETVKACLDVADAVIVGSCLKTDGKATSPLDAGRVKSFMAAARGG